MMNEADKKKPLLLVVDDNPRNLQLLCALLRLQIDCDLVVALNGNEAISQSLAAHPDLILLDVMMPGLDGYETCEKLKADSRTEDIPIIFLTAKTQPDEIVKGFNAGAVDYVTKPFQGAELMARVKTQLKIQESYRIIRQQNDERKQLLHVLCHDLANPFASMISCLDMVSDGDSFLRLKAALMETAENGLSLIDMVRRIRSLEEKGILKPENAVALVPLVKRARMVLLARFNAKQITLTVDVPESMMVKVEPVSFVNSVLNNLLSNAIKFSPAGATIELKARPQEQSAVIQIRDRGIGMPDEIVKSLFDLSKTTSRPGTAGESGTGFGMPLVKRFVEAAGGTIQVESRDREQYPDQHGTEITLTVPAA